MHTRMLSINCDAVHVRTSLRGVSRRVKELWYLRRLAAARLSCEDERRVLCKRTDERLAATPDGKRLALCKQRRRRAFR